MDWQWILQMWICLLVAGLLGAILGWLFAKATGRSKLKELENSWSAQLHTKEQELFTYQNRSREQIETMKSDLENVHLNIGVHENTIAEFQSKTDRLMAEVSQKNTELAAAHTSVANAQSISQSDASEMARLRSAIALVESDASVKGKALIDLEDQLQDANNQLSSQKIELTDMQSKLAAGTTISSQLSISTDRVTTLETQMKDAGNAISFRDAEISKLRARLSKLEVLEAKIKDCESTNHTQEAEIAALKSQMATAQKQFTTTLASLKSQQTAPQLPIETDLIRIQGVGKIFFEKMCNIGVPTQAELLRQGNTKKGREELSAKSGIDERLILTWVNHVDLIRINGVNEQYAELLEAAGVDTVPELATRKADNLFAKLVELNNGERKISSTTPSLLEVQSWIGHAKSLGRVVSH